MRARGRRWEQRARCGDQSLSCSSEDMASHFGKSHGELLVGRTPVRSAALRSAALYGSRAGRESRAFVQTTRPRTLPRPVHGSTGPQVRVQSGPRSGPRSGGSRRSAAAPRLTLSVTPSVRTAAARAPRIPTRRPADTTGSNLMRIAMFAWYLEINRLIIRRKKRHSSIWIHGVKPFVCTKITPDEA